MKTSTWTVSAACLLMAAGVAAASETADIKVMTQNQYLGADLAPIVTTQDPASYAAAIVSLLQSVAANNLPERAGALAESIADRRPHLVALQEVVAVGCIDGGTGACVLFAGAFNDHLSATMSALSARGADYNVAAVVQNWTVPTPFMLSMGIPGLPVFLDNDAIPDLFITALDRDVILARGDVDTDVVEYECIKPSLDGCNFQNVATATTLAGPISIERGFVAVDAIVAGARYRLVNTHLEVKSPIADPLAPLLQAVQATELNFILATQPAGDATSRLIVAGDINSAPTDPMLNLPIGPLHRPYQQFTNGTDFAGTPGFAPLTDTWTLRRGAPEGLTCCQAADLLNAQSLHHERVDVIFALPAPSTVKANVLDAEPTDKTVSGLWPSDHASVIAELRY